MSYAEAKIAEAHARGDARAFYYWTYVKAAIDECTPRTDGQRVELRAVFAVTPKREAPMADTQQDTQPLPTRTTRVPRGQLGAAVTPEAQRPKLSFQSSI